MKKGFTLIELLIVISIIAILSVIAVIAVVNQIFKANDARRKAELKRIGTAVEEYEKDKDCYPTLDIVTCANSGTGLMPYLSSIPCDPVTNTSYYYEPENSTCPKWYKLYTNLQNENDSDYNTGIGPNGGYSYVSSSPNAPAEQSQQGNFYGCFGGVCTPISGPVCQPNYGSSTCYGGCSNPLNECQN